MDNSGRLGITFTHRESDRITIKFQDEKLAKNFIDWLRSDKLKIIPFIENMNPDSWFCAACGTFNKAIHDRCKECKTNRIKPGVIIHEE